MGRDVEKRANRGKKMSALIEENKDADDDFWNQDAFKDDEEDNEYQEEREDDDVFDSDFDMDEPDDDEADGEEVDKRERRQPKKKVLPGRPVKKAKKAMGKAGKKGTKDASLSIEKAAAAAEKGLKEDEGGGAKRPARRGRPKRAMVEEEEEEGEEREQAGSENLSMMERRKSTRAVVILKDRQREREQAHRAAVASKTVKKKKVEVEERRMTQEEMLQEAAQTEMQNVQRLEIMLAREEEVKRRAIIEKEVFSGPQIRYHSTAEKTVLEFLKFASLPETIKAKAPPYPKRVVCVVTGLPAKYRDPLTGLPYATKEAFRILRERAAKGEGIRGVKKGARGSGLRVPGSKGKPSQRGPSPGLSSRSPMPTWRSSELQSASLAATGEARGRPPPSGQAGTRPGGLPASRPGGSESRGTIGVSRLSKNGGRMGGGGGGGERTERGFSEEGSGHAGRGGEGAGGVNFLDDTEGLDDVSPIGMDFSF